MTVARAALAIGIFVAAVVGGLALRAARESTGGALAPDAAIRSRVTREEAIASAHANAELLFFRIDRTAAKLLTLAELGGNVGQDDWRIRPVSPPMEGIWVVAFSGLSADESHCLAGCTPRPGTPTWHTYSVDALAGAVIGRSAGFGSWPPGFDRLPDHPVTLVTSPPAPPPLVFDRLGLEVPLQTYTVDPGKGVARADPEPHRRVVLRATDPARLAALLGDTLHASDDAGATWRAVTPSFGARDIAMLGTRTLLAGRDGIYASTDLALWERAKGLDAIAERLLPGVTRLFVWQRAGRTLALAESPEGRTSRILASSDGTAWRYVTEIAGRAVFAGADVPILGVEGSAALVRVEGTELAQLVAVAVGTPFAVSALAGDPDTGVLWSFARDGLPEARRSVDGGRTWSRADEGMWETYLVGGIFFVGAHTFALSPTGAWWWDGGGWRRHEFDIDVKPGALVQAGRAVFVVGLGGGRLYRLK